MTQSGSTPAWQVCDAIIAKAREELLSQAISVMHEQLDKKRISLEGRLTTLTEGENERERDMFLLRQLIKERENIERQFAGYLDTARLDKDALERTEELQKFLLSLRQIVLFYSYGKVCEAWLVEVEKELKEKSPEKILMKTVMQNTHERKEVLDYLLRGKEFVGLFSEEEKKIIERTLKLIG